jgi:hypothetical protein
MTIMHHQVATATTPGVRSGGAVKYGDGLKQKGMHTAFGTAFHTGNDTATKLAAAKPHGAPTSNALLMLMISRHA